MRRLVRTLLLTLAAAVTFGALGDASPPQQPAPAPTPAPTPTPPPAPAAAPAPPAGDIEDFVPSEKVSADDAVSFPTDI
jgi:hypothetical protein